MTRFGWFVLWPNGTGHMLDVPSAFVRAIQFNFNPPECEWRARVCRIVGSIKSIYFVSNYPCRCFITARFLFGWNPFGYFVGGWITWGGLSVKCSQMRDWNRRFDEKLTLDYPKRGPPFRSEIDFRRHALSSQWKYQYSITAQLIHQWSNDGPTVSWSWRLQSNAQQDEMKISKNR